MSTDNEDRRWRLYRPPNRNTPRKPEETGVSKPPPAEPTRPRGTSPEFTDADDKDAFTYDQWVAATNKSGGKRSAFIVSGAVVLAVTGIAIASKAGSPRTLEAQGPDGSRRESVATDFFDQVRETYGDRVYSLSLYPDYAFVEVPVEGGDRRSITYSWHPGEGFTESTKNSGLDRQVWDLDRYDRSLTDRLCTEAETLVEDPELCYLLIQAPDDYTKHWITVYASNDFRETGRLTARLDGSIMERDRPGED